MTEELEPTTDEAAALDREDELPVVARMVVEIPAILESARVSRTRD